MDGSPFPAPVALAGDVSRRLEHWTRTVTSTSRPRLIVQLDAARRRRRLAPVGARRRRARARRSPSTPPCATERGGRPVADEWPRLGRLCRRSTASATQRRGQVSLSQDEAWELMTDDRPGARGGRLRRPGAGAVAAQGRRRRCACSPSRRAIGRRRPPAQQRALVGGVRRRRAHRRRRRPAGRRGPPAGAVARALGRARPGRPQGGRRRARRAGRRPSSPAPRSCATRVGLEGSALARRRRRSRATAGPPTCSSRPARRRPTPVTTPEGFVGELRTLPGRGARLARLPRRRRARRLPRPRHGPRQDADGARPPRPHRRATARRS